MTEADSNPVAPPDHKEVLNVNVGVLGHVDSGKTSLVKTLSTLLSTAALDKSKQSRERGK
jgi:selenocysteine-specific elongation factor